MLTLSMFGLLFVLLFSNDIELAEELDDAVEFKCEAFLLVSLLIDFTLLL